MADIISPPPGLDEAIANDTAIGDETEAAPAAQQVASTSIPQSNQNEGLPDPNILPHGIDTAPAGLNEDISPEMLEEHYGGARQQAITGLESIGKGVLGPIAPAIERVAGVSPTSILGRAETNPVARIGGELIGLIGSAAAGKGLGALLGDVGKATEAAATAQGIGKIGSMAVRGAIESMVFQGQDELSKLVLSDPNQSAENALVDIGMAGGLGGILGGGLGAVNPLWDKVSSTKMGGILKAIANKTGGIEGAEFEPVNDMISQTGIEMAPEIKAGLSKDPHIKEMFTTLNQSDTTESGKAFQESYHKFRKQAGDAIVSALGKTPEEVETLGQLSKYEAGKEIGNTLADEYNAQVNPLAKGFDDLKTRFRDIPLNEPVKDQAGNILASGTVDKINDKIASLAIHEGWASSPSSDIMREVNRAMKEIPLQKNVKNLSDYITQFQNNTMSDPLNGPLRRAGGMVSRILKDAEADVIGSHLGETEGPAAVAKFADLRKAYAAQSNLKDALDSRLSVRGSTSGYAKSLKEAAQTDGESILRKLSTKNDAEMLSFLQKNYPKTAELLKDYHISDLLKTASDKAKTGFTINSENLVKNLNKLSPELREFIASPESLNKINAIGGIVDEFNSMPHNFSNTARTLDKLTKHIPGTALGLAAALHSHSGITGAVVGALTHVIGKEIPDATKLALLKFLGSSGPIDSGGFSAMAGMINKTIKAQNTMTKAVKSVFRSDMEMPSAIKSSMSDNQALDKNARALQLNPDLFMKTNNKVGYYMPEFSSALMATATNAVNYVNSQRPSEATNAPLDSKPVLSSAKLASYNRTLENVQQPLTTLARIKNGSITSKDVQDLQAVYPGVYNSLRQKLTDELITAKSKNIEIPYATKMGLSVFMAQPLDSTLTPQGIQAASQGNLMPPAILPQKDIGQAPKVGNGSEKALGKMPSMYQTSGQSAEQRRLRAK